MEKLARLYPYKVEIFTSLIITLVMVSTIYFITGYFMRSTVKRALVSSLITVLIKKFLIDVYLHF